VRAHDNSHRDAEPTPMVNIEVAFMPASSTHKRRRKIAQWYNCF